MRVIEVSSYGGPEVLRPVERPDPVPAGGQVRVRVAATSVNPADLWTRAGAMAARTPDAVPPIVLGWDFAGELLDPAPGFTVGQLVAGLYPWFTLGDGSGTYAEIVLADPAWLARLPAGADPVAATTVAMNGLTAAQALRLTGVAAGQTLVVTGASGTVGGFAVELAAANGVQVLAVPSIGDEQYVGSLGAAVVLPRTGGAELVAALRERYPDGVDAVLDAAAAVPELIGAVRDHGRFIAVTDPTEPKAERGIHVETVHTVPDGAELTGLLEQWAAGALHTRVVDVLPLAEAAAAHRRLAAGGVHGKLVLTP